MSTLEFVNKALGAAIYIMAIFGLLFAAMSERPYLLAFFGVMVLSLSIRDRGAS